MTSVRLIGMTSRNIPLNAPTIGQNRSPLFDAWLQTALQQRFDQTLEEELPEELLDLLSEQPAAHSGH